MLSRTHLIKSKDPEYYKFLYNKRVALVGPSSNTLNTKQGGDLDNYDLVVRLNKSLPIPKNKRIDIGSKTDILYNSFNLSDYPGENNLNIDKLENEIKYISSPYPFIYPFSDDILKFISKNNSRLPIHLIDLIIYKLIVSILKCRPYTGTCAIVDLLQFPIKELYITGIDCYLCKYYKEYRKISKNQLKSLQYNNIHQNTPQLLFIKNLALNDSRVKLDDFLNNYFFNKEYKIYNNIKTVNDVYKILKGNSLEEILNNKKTYVYTNNYYNNCIIINDSMNYKNLYRNADIVFNFNNNNIDKDVQVNNDIKYLIDFNIKIDYLNSIMKYTDIENILLINLNIIKQYFKINYFKNINFRTIIIFIIVSKINSLLYIERNIIKDFSKEELDYLKYLQYINKIKVFKG